MSFYRLLERELFTTFSTDEPFYSRVQADELSVHLLYRNALDIHGKHAASHLHVAECAT